MSFEILNLSRRPSNDAALRGFPSLSIRSMRLFNLVTGHPCGVPPPLRGGSPSGKMCPVGALCFCDGGMPPSRPFFVETFGKSLAVAPRFSGLGNIKKDLGKRSATGRRQSLHTSIGERRSRWAKWGQVVVGACAVQHLVHTVPGLPGIVHGQGATTARTFAWLLPPSGLRPPSPYTGENPVVCRVGGAASLTPWMLWPYLLQR